MHDQCSDVDADVVHMLAGRDQCCMHDDDDDDDDDSNNVRLLYPALINALSADVIHRAC